MIVTIFHIVYLSLTTRGFSPLLRDFPRKNFVLLFFSIFIISLVLFDISCKDWSKRVNSEISVYSTHEILRYFSNNWCQSLEIPLVQLKFWCGCVNTYDTSHIYDTIHIHKNSSELKKQSRNVNSQVWYWEIWWEN